MDWVCAKVGNCKALIFGTELAQNVADVLPQLEVLHMVMIAV